MDVIETLIEVIYDVEILGWTVFEIFMVCFGLLCISASLVMLYFVQKSQEEPTTKWVDEMNEFAEELEEEFRNNDY